MEDVETADAVRATQIKTILPRFNPGKEFKKVLATVEYEKGALVSAPPEEEEPT